MIMFGNGTVKSMSGDKYIMKTETFVATDTALPAKENGEASTEFYKSGSGWINTFEGPDGTKYKKINPKFYDATGKVATAFVKDEKYFCSYDLKAEGSVIEVSANTFPGTLTNRAPMWGNKKTTNQFGELLEAVA